MNAEDNNSAGAPSSVLDTADSLGDRGDPKTAALAVDNLRLSYKVRGVPRVVLRGVTFQIRPGEAFGLVGESGCGKSTTAYAAMRYLPDNAVIDNGHVLSHGTDVLGMSWGDLRRYRATQASMVYQDPVQAMNPSLRIGQQVEECYRILGHSKAEAAELAREALVRVHIAAPDSVLKRYPHQLSGGMLQRVVIAMGLVGDPQLLVLDEPTTGLDATVEAEVLDLVRELTAGTDAAVLLIAHNLGVIRSMCDRVGVMYAGRIVEEGEAQSVFDAPQHPYTIGLLNSIPRRGLQKSERELFTIPGNLPQIGTLLPNCVYVDRCPLATDVCSTERTPVVEIAEGHWTRCHHADRLDQIAVPDHSAVEHEAAIDDQFVVLDGISKTFTQGNTRIPALVDIELGFGRGETLGLVGESGSGKSTLAKVLLGVHSPDEVESTAEDGDATSTKGKILLEGYAMAPLAKNRRDRSIRAFQMVFQNPDSALNRSWTVRRILKRSVEKLTGIKGAAADRKVDELAEGMRLSQRHLGMRPRQLSGGLKQRVAIARAFAGDPDIVVCDEPTSALDVSVQAAILNLLVQLQQEDRTSYLFITHDINVVRYISDRIAVMYVGRIMELGKTDDLFGGINHPYTEALLSAVPSIDGKADNRIPLDGEIPSPANPPSGCVFHTRCHRFIPGTCDVAEPELKEVTPGHWMRCVLDAEQLSVPVEITPHVADI